MSFLRFSRERSSKESFEPKPAKEDLLGFDLLYQLTYLSSVAAAGVPRGQLFSLGAELDCSTSDYFGQVDRLAKNMNYQYSEACQAVGQSTKQPEVKSLFLRMSSALATGESPVDFMTREAEIQAEAYSNAYEGKLEAMKKWSDAYIALLVSVALIIIVAAISTVIYDLGLMFVAGMVATMVVVAIGGAWVISRAAPKEVKTLDGAEGLESQRVPRKLLMVLFPSALTIGVLAMATGMAPGMAIVAVGAFFLPIGVAGWRLDNSVNKQDDEISTFLRVLGTTASSIGTTPVEAMERMNLRSMGYLASRVKSLYVMLRSRVAPELCWARFVTGTGSELIKRGVKVFLDGLRYGGDAEEVGAKASLLTMKINFMRDKRRGVATTFGWLTLAMHVTLVFLLVFVIEIVDGFGMMIATAGLDATSPSSGSIVSTSFSFNFQNLEVLRMMLLPVLVILSIINAVTPKVVEGGYSHKLFFSLGLTLLATGLALVMCPKLATVLLNMNAI